MTIQNYDVVVIGAGPAGYVAAIRCAQLGLNTACVDAWINEAGRPSLGGTCLNVGCIPSKALLDSSHIYHHLTHQSEEHGIKFQQASIDIAAMQRRKDNIVTTLTKGIEGLFKKNRVKRLSGTGKLAGNRHVAITSTEDGTVHSVQAQHIIIATGSKPLSISQAPIDGDRIVDSSGALAFGEVPPRLGVIGAGVIGLELGSVWNRLGAKVIVLEALDTFLPAVDQVVAKAAFQSFHRQGLDIQLASTLRSVKATNTGVELEYKNSAGNQRIEVDKLIVAVGRAPYTKGLGSKEVGLERDERGYIRVDEHWRTNLEGIYAIGDVTGGPMLAHKGSEEGIAVAEVIAGQAGHVNFEAIPWVIYTWPEIAWVGKTSQKLSGEGIEYQVGSFPFMASGRARNMGETEGSVKIIADAKTDRVLGVHIFGPYASELIAEAVLAMECDASAEDLARTVHAHPTLAEAMHEAALAVDGRAVHI